MVGGTAVLAVVATVLIVNNNSSKPSDAIPAANEVALQMPADPGPAPFTQSVETASVSAPPAAGGATSSAAGSPTGIHSVQGSSAGLYAGSMSQASCDVERLITMTSTGDTGRAWASVQGIQQSAIPSYLRSLTSAYLRVDTRVTNHGYKSGAVSSYQSVLQAGTAVLVDSQGVPRVRCACGNPLTPPSLVTDAKYTGKSWTGFQPSTLVVVVPAPQPVTEIILVNVATGGWFARVTGQIKVEDHPVQPPKELAPGIPPAAPMKPLSPSASVSGSTSASTSGSHSASSSGASSGPSSGSTSGSTGPSTGTASASHSSGTPSGPSSTASTASSPPSTASSAPPSSVTKSAAPSTASVAPSTATVTASTATATVGTATATTTTTATGTTTAATVACATVLPSTLPPCPTATGGGPS
ncbi:hypothetical protein OH807_04530 [Kitasatospora sp. NBC_01560]|uniref:DUF6777 domain-containing protein n=1 Tax=Kitasatospora sp. NBC_01560 TaxID=2975965 RepID=UPI0038649C99